MPLGRGLQVEGGNAHPTIWCVYLCLSAESLSHYGALFQEEVNQAARRENRPNISLINHEELARIEELIAANTYPEKWDGTEPRGDEWLPEILPDGSIQLLLFDKF